MVPRLLSLVCLELNLLWLHAHLLLRLSLFQRRICDLNFCVGVSAGPITIGPSVLVSGLVARVPGCDHRFCRLLVLLCVSVGLLFNLYPRLP